MSRFKMLCLLAVLVHCVLALTNHDYRQEKLLLNSVDLDHLAVAFEAEEFEISHIPRRYRCESNLCVIAKLYRK